MNLNNKNIKKKQKIKIGKKIIFAEVNAVPVVKKKDDRESLAEFKKLAEKNFFSSQ